METKKSLLARSKTVGFPPKRPLQQAMSVPGGSGSLTGDGKENAAAMPQSQRQQDLEQPLKKFENLSLKVKAEVKVDLLRHALGRKAPLNQQQTIDTISKKQGVEEEEAPPPAARNNVVVSSATDRSKKLRRQQEVRREQQQQQQQQQQRHQQRHQQRPQRLQHDQLKKKEPAPSEGFFPQNTLPRSPPVTAIPTSLAPSPSPSPSLPSSSSFSISSGSFPPSEPLSLNLARLFDRIAILECERAEVAEVTARTREVFETRLKREEEIKDGLVTMKEKLVDALRRKRTFSFFKVSNYLQGKGKCFYMWSRNVRKVVFRTKMKELTKLLSRSSFVGYLHIKCPGAEEPLIIPLWEGLFNGPDGRPVPFTLGQKQIKFKYVSTLHAELHLKSITTSGDEKNVLYISPHASQMNKNGVYVPHVDITLGGHREMVVADEGGETELFEMTNDVPIYLSDPDSPEFATKCTIRYRYRYR